MSETHATSAESPVLCEVVRRLVDSYHPERIYLFGSAARGDVGPDSDYDLLLVVPDKTPSALRREDLGYRALRGTGTAVDFPSSRHANRTVIACPVLRDSVVVGVPHPTEHTEILFYDGHCGLCHRGVKFVLKHDRAGAAFRFAPLQGESFQAAVPVEQRAGLPDSMVVRTHDGSLLIRSDASVHILRRLPGGWKALAALVAAVPRPLRDLAYDFIARIRYRVFGQRDDLCPDVPPHLRERFDP